MRLWVPVKMKRSRSPTRAATLSAYKIDLAKKAPMKLKKVKQSSRSLIFYSSYSVKKPLFREASTLCAYT